MAKLTELNQYLIREKFLKIFGNKFHIMDENDQLYGFCEQKRFRIKEDIRNIIVPMAAYKLGSRPLILPADYEISARITGHPEAVQPW